MKQVRSHYIIDSGVDWLTLTAKPEQSGYDECLELWRFLLISAQNEGHDLKKFDQGGYHGWKCGNYIWGERPMDRIFTATGYAGTTAVEHMKEVKFRGNIPRMDVQSTIRPTLAKAKSLRQLNNWQHRRWREGKTNEVRKKTEISSPKGTETVQLGSPTSHSRVVAYDAAARHPELYEGEAQRYECRFGKRCTIEPYARLLAGKSIASTCQTIVVSKLQAIGLKERWHAGIPTSSPMSGTVKTTDQRRLAWFADDIRRIAVEMALRGLGEDIAESLGCVEFVVRPEFLPKPPTPRYRATLTKTGLR